MSENGSLNLNDALLRNEMRKIAQSQFNRSLKQGDEQESDDTQFMKILSKLIDENLDEINQDYKAVQNHTKQAPKPNPANGSKIDPLSGFFKIKDADFGLHS